MQFTDPLKIECCFPMNGEYVLICIALPIGATVKDVVKHLRLSPELFIISIWSKRVKLDTPITTGDRVEFNLPLAKDPRRRLLEITLK